jgi:PBSX family phage portal protein
MAVTVKKTPPKEESKVSFVNKVIRGDTYLVMADSAYQPEDEFLGLYYTTSDKSKLLIEPPYDPKKLIGLVTQNNVLNQCITAMEVNIDGTGHELVPHKSDAKVADGEAEKINAFLDEPYPGQSLVTLRRALRRDIEGAGWGVLEVLRFLDAGLAAIRNVPVSTVRFVKLDQPVQVKKKLTRQGKEIEITLWERERRFAQRVGAGAGAVKLRFYKEYGCTRVLHRDTGEWETPAAPVPPDMRATELLVFTKDPDVNTPYGIPSWINELPSVLGSRKAEEHILEFFDSGGMPPAIIFIEGGTLAKDMSNQLKAYVSGQLKSRHRAAIVEAQSSSGTLDSSGKVSVKVERFGAESVKDSMFQNYDKNTEEHVRVGFRLPPLFLGRSSDYNYASAQVSYMLAEAQVFEPERNEFDEIFNLTIMRELGAKTCSFRSKKITLKNAEAQIAALTLAKDVSKGPGFVDEINRVAGINLEYQKPILPVVAPGLSAPRADRKPGAVNGPKLGSGGSHVATPKGVKRVVQGVPGKKPKVNVKKAAELVDSFLEAEGIVEPSRPYTEDEVEGIREAIDALPEDEKEMFVQLLSLNAAELIPPEEAVA